MEYKKMDGVSSPPVPKSKPKRNTQAEVLKALHEKGFIKDAGGDYIPKTQIVDDGIQIGPQNKPFEFPDWVTPDMMQRIGNNKYNEGDYFDPAILQKAVDSGAFNNIDAYVETPSGVNHRFTPEQQKEIADLQYNIGTNADLLRVIGVPREQLMDLNRRKAEKDFMLNQMDRNSVFDNPATPSYEKISDRSLGLDPSKFTKKAWNPSNYQSGLKSIVDNIRKQQESVLGPEPKELTVEEQDAFNKAKLKKLMGY